MDDSRIRSKTAPFSFENGLVWTGPKVIPPKLFLDVVPSFFGDITYALRGCFCGGSIYVSFHLKAKENL